MKTKTLDAVMAKKRPLLQTVLMNWFNIPELESPEFDILRTFFVWYDNEKDPKVLIHRLGARWCFGLYDFPYDEELGFCDMDDLIDAATGDTLRGELLTLKSFVLRLPRRETEEIQKFRFSPKQVEHFFYGKRNRMRLEEEHQREYEQEFFRQKYAATLN